MMRRHDVSPEDLAEALRMQGIDDVIMSRLVTFERGGNITAIPKAWLLRARFSAFISPTKRYAKREDTFSRCETRRRDA
jgi:uncharacterized membrane protein YcaP (DUF421 family)